MKTILFTLSFHILFVPMLLGEIKTLDFSDGDHSFSVFEKGGVELTPFPGIHYLRTISGGTYKIILPGKVEYLLKIDRGEVRNDLKQKDYANSTKLFTDYLSLEAAKKLSYTFHEQFGLRANDLDQWFKKLEAGKAYSVYGKGGLNYNFPFLAMSLRTTFGKKQPAFAIFSIGWDEKFSRQSGRTLEKNKELNVVYDMPKLLEGIPEFTEVEEVEPVVVSIKDKTKMSLAPSEIIEEVIEESLAPKQVPERPVGAVTIEHARETIEKPSNWWLWLIGLLVVVVGGFLVLRRKS